MIDHGERHCSVLKRAMANDIQGWKTVFETLNSFRLKGPKISDWFVRLISNNNSSVAAGSCQNHFVFPQQQQQQPVTKYQPNNSQSPQVLSAPFEVQNADSMGTVLNSPLLQPNRLFPSSRSTATPCPISTSSQTASIQQQPTTTSHSEVSTAVVCHSRGRAFGTCNLKFSDKQISFFNSYGNFLIVEWHIEVETSLGNSQVRQIFGDDNEKKLIPVTALEGDLTVEVSTEDFRKHLSLFRKHCSIDLYLIGSRRSNCLPVIPLEIRAFISQYMFQKKKIVRKRLSKKTIGGEKIKKKLVSSVVSKTLRKKGLDGQIGTHRRKPNSKKKDVSPKKCWDDSDKLEKSDQNHSVNGEEEEEGKKEEEEGKKEEAETKKKEKRRNRQEKERTEKDEKEEEEQDEEKGDESITNPEIVKRFQVSMTQTFKNAGSEDLWQMSFKMPNLFFRQLYQLISPRHVECIFSFFSKGLRVQLINREDGSLNTFFQMKALDDSDDLRNSKTKSSPVNQKKNEKTTTKNVSRKKSENVKKKDKSEKKRSKTHIVKSEKKEIIPEGEQISDLCHENDSQKRGIRKWKISNNQSISPTSSSSFVGEDEKEMERKRGKIVIEEQTKPSEQGAKKREDDSETCELEDGSDNEGECRASRNVDDEQSIFSSLPIFTFTCNSDIIRSLRRAIQNVGVNNHVRIGFTHHQLLLMNIPWGSRGNCWVFVRDR